MSDIQDIYDFFSGQIDRQIIEDVYQALNGNSSKIIEQLLEICPLDGEIGPLIDKQKNTLYSAVDVALTAVKNENKNIAPKHEHSNRSTVLGQKDATNLIKRYVTDKEKVLILLRGCPGSGKSTLAQKIRFNGVILSTDDHISFDKFDVSSFANMADVLKRNQELVLQAMNISKNPIVVDSLNIQISDMLPYANMADCFGYAIEVIEPDVQWRLKSDVLAKKNVHGVKKDKIAILLNEYDDNINGNDLFKMVRQSESMENNVSDDYNDFNICDAPTPSYEKMYDETSFEHLSDAMKASLTISEQNNIEDNNDQIDNIEQTLQYLQSCFPNVDSEIIGSLYNEGVHKLEDLMDILSDIGDQYIDLPKQWEENLDSNYYMENDEYDFTQFSETNQENNLPFTGFNPLVLSQEAGDQLLQLFGIPPNFYPLNNGKGYEIDLNFELAQMIHQSWTGLKDESSDTQSDSGFSDSTKSNMSYDLEADFPVIDQSNMLSTKIKSKQLADKYPGIHKEVLRNIFVESGYKMEAAVRKIENTPNLLEQPKVSMTKEYANVLRNSRTNKPIETQPRDNMASAPGKTENFEDEYMKLIERMRKSESQFKDNVGKAKNAFTGKQYSVAHIYSSKAQAMKKKFQEEKDLCAELLADKMYESCSRTGTIDLHGLKVKEATDLISNFFSYYGYDIARTRSQISIITGRGMHSDGGVAKIKPCVEAYLKKNNFSYVETNPGILKVNLRK